MPPNVFRDRFIPLSDTVFEIFQSSNRYAHLQESHRALRDGSFGVTLSQALRARLRSHRPSGTRGSEAAKRIRNPGLSPPALRGATTPLLHYSTTPLPHYSITP